MRLQLTIAILWLINLYKVHAQSPACGIGFGEDVCAPHKTVIVPRPGPYGTTTYGTSQGTAYGTYQGSAYGSSSSYQKGQTIVVRPVELPKPVIEPAPLPPPPKVVAPPPAPPALPVPPLLPIGGPCACKSTLVKPAIVPKPVCLASPCSGSSAAATNHQVVGQTTSSQVVVGGCGGGVVNTVGYGGGVCNTVGYNTQGYQHGTTIITPGSNNPASVIPADAVSMTIAYNLAKKACAKSEDKLFFGFRQLPKEVPRIEQQVVVKKCVRIPEDSNLFKINGEVVELKVPKTSCSSTKTLAEEAAEELLDLAAEEQEENVDIDVPVRKISLGEIGYGPAKTKSVGFVDVPPVVTSAVDAVSDAVEDAIGGLAGAGASGAAGGICNDGFVSGTVAVANVPQLEPMLSRPKLEPKLEPCDDSIEDSLVPIGFGYKQYTSCKQEAHQSSSLLQKIVNKFT